MSLPYDRTNVNPGLNSDARLNAELEKIRVALRQGLSRLGAAPNGMEADLDMGLNDILNVDTVYAQDLFIDGQQLPNLQEIIDTVAGVEADALAAEQAADSAQTSASEASASAVAAAASELEAENAEANATAQAAAALTSRNESEGFSIVAAGHADDADQAAADALADRALAQGAAITAGNHANSAADSANNALIAEAGAIAAQDGAELARAEAEAAAAGVNLPSITPGTAGQYLRVNPAEDGYELNELLEQTAVSPLVSGDFTGGYVALRRVGNIVFGIINNPTNPSLVLAETATGFFPAGFVPTASIWNTARAQGVTADIFVDSSSGQLSIAYGAASTGISQPLGFFYYV